MATHTIAVAGKGGVGKTTTCGMIIDYLCKQKKGPILVVDADANSNLNEVLGVEVETTLGDIREEMARAEQKGTVPANMTKADYAEMKFNPLAGCLPMLLQMPIFIALFQVLREMGDRIGEGTYSFYNLVPNLVTTPSQAFGEGFGTFVPYLILMIIFAGATFLPMVLQQLKTENTQQKNQTLMMGAIMSLMMLWISWGSPAGVLLFWGASSLIGIGQNQLTLARCRAADRRKEEEEALVVKPIEVNVTRKEKKKRPKKKR